MIQIFIKFELILYLINNKSIRPMLKKYFNDYDSEEDEDYNPTRKEEAEYKLEHERRKRMRISELSTQELWQQMQLQHKNNLKKVKSDQNLSQNTLSNLELAEKIINSDSIKPNQKIFFAGKQFILNQETGQLEIVEKAKINISEKNIQEQNEDAHTSERNRTKIAYQYLNHVMKAIHNRSRKINSIGKSKLDWKGFVKQQGIEDKLKYNRKGGVIEDMHFIKKAV